MSSPTQGMWECSHGVDGRDYCEECCSKPVEEKVLSMSCPICGTFTPVHGFAFNKDGTYKEEPVKSVAKKPIKKF